MINYLKKEQLEKIAEEFPPGHWDRQPLEDRWDYHQKAIDVVRSLELSDPAQILEMGTMGAPLVKESHTMDIESKWNFPGKSPTYVHDARMTPWPLRDKQYELFIALRVYQHLAPFQKECFLEARRIARKVLIVVPGTYRNSVHPESRGITYQDFCAWNDDVPPIRHMKTRMGDLFLWDNDAPSGLSRLYGKAKRLVGKYRRG